MSRLGRLLRSHDDTQPWSGAYAPYDLVKELIIAIAVFALIAVGLTILFSSPDERPSTIAQWSRQMPVDFAKTATAELGGTSATAEYGPPYNPNKASEQHIAFVRLQKWLGTSHPINTAEDYVINPLRSIPADPALNGDVDFYQAPPEKQ